MWDEGASGDMDLQQTEDWAIWSFFWLFLFRFKTSLQLLQLFSRMQQHCDFSFLQIAYADLLSRKESLT